MWIIRIIIICFHYGDVKSDSTELEGTWTRMFKRYIRGRVTLNYIIEDKFSFSITKKVWISR